MNISSIGMFVLPFMLFAVAPADSPVADAAQRGDIETVRSLLQVGADVNAAQGDGMTALHWAAMNGNEPMADMLIYAGANLRSTTRLGAYTPLHLASKAGHDAVVETLLEAGSDAGAMTTTGVAAIHLAAASGRANAVLALLEHDASVDARDSTSGRTPLMYGVANRRLEAVEALIEAGADLSIATNVMDFAAISKADGADRQRRDKLMAATREAKAPPGEDAAEAVPHQSVADASAAQLQSRDENAEPRAEDEKANEEKVEEPPRSVSEEAAAQLQSRDARAEPVETEEEGKDETTKEEGAKQPQPLSFSDLVGSQGGMTALHYAARDGRVAIARLLLGAGADIDQPTLGDHSTALLVATINGNYDLAMLFLERGADPNIASEDGAAPLFATVNNRWAPKALYPQPTAFKQQKTTYLEYMEVLLEKDANVNAQLKTHVWYTSYNFDLLGVNFQNATPFWRAAYATDVPAMKLLVAYGANPSIPTTKPPPRRRRGGGGNDSGDSKDEGDPSGLPEVAVGGPAVYPIHAASGVGYGVSRAGNSHRHAPAGWLPAVQYLVEELGADVNRRDHDGYSAVHHAAARGDNEVISYLVERGADVMFVSRRGQTTVDMANGPQQRVQPFPETIALLESLGAKNNHKCLSC